jgi:hypothetical protein
VATLTHTAMTIGDLAKMLDPDGTLAVVADVLMEKNRFFETALWLPGNGETTHRYSRDVDQPAGKHTAINEGVQKSVAIREQKTAKIAMLEDYSYVDERLLRISPDPVGVRSREDGAFVAGMSKTAVDTVFHGSETTDPNAFDGLWNQDDWSTLASDQVINSGGDATGGASVALIEWGDDAAHLIYPKNAAVTPMIEVEDLGQQLVEDASNNPYTCQVSHFFFNYGIAVRDPRNVQRLANVVNLGTGSGALDEDNLIAMINELVGEGEGSNFYMNRQLRKWLLIIAKDKANVQYMPSEAFGKPPRMLANFMGVPINVTEKLGFTEPQVS